MTKIFTTQQSAARRLLHFSIIEVLLYTHITVIILMNYLFLD